MDMVIMLMEKEPESGFLIKEVGSYAIKNQGSLVDGIFLTKDKDIEIVHIRVTVDKDVKDWEYSAIFDEYDSLVFHELVLSFEELEDTYNPTWELTFEFQEDQAIMEKILNNILDVHKKELNRVWDNIVDKKSDYE